MLKFQQRMQAQQGKAPEPLPAVSGREEYEEEEIIDYFKGCQTSSLEVAKEELADGNYSWEQLKIVRIKFLCEYGN